MAALKVDNNTDDSSNSDDEPTIPQPRTYPLLKQLRSPLSPEFTSTELSSLNFDEYLLIDPAAAQDLPEGENCQLAKYTVM